MKIFILGLPQSGRSTVAKAVTEAHSWQYIDATSWIKSSFRSQNKDEHLQQYEDEYKSFLIKWMTVNPDSVIHHVQDMIKVSDSNIFIIDGISSPRDFASLFDYREDVVVFLNRTDNEFEYRDHDGIGMSVMRDYCYWMASAGLLDKHRWLEYNFKIPGEENDYVKSLGAQNSVFIIKSINKVIDHLIAKLVK